MTSIVVHRDAVARSSDACDPVVAPIAPVPRLTDRRGPLRPRNLVTTRRRLRGAVIAHAFRSLDAVFLMLFITLAIEFSEPDGLMRVAVGDALPRYTAILATLVLLDPATAYDFATRERAAAHLIRVASAFAAVGAVVVTCLSLGLIEPARAHDIGRDLALGCAILMLAHCGWLLLVRRWRRRGMLTPNIVVVGANENARLLIARAIERGDIAVLGIFDDRVNRSPTAIDGVPVLGTTDDLIGHRIMPYVDRVVITVTAAAEARIRAMVARMRVLPNDISLFVDIGTTDATVETLDRLTEGVLGRAGGGLDDYRRILAKRIEDLLVGCIALLLASPLMLFIAVAVKLDSRGPVFFRQRRHGFNNEEIVIWKFRSMKDRRSSERLVMQVRRDDARVTRVGRVLRKTSLDELPQLFNVLRGEMSLVGPRPHAPTMTTGGVQSALLVADYAQRHRIKPGMTGWAAINGSRGPVDTPDEVRRRVELDIAYIERHSVWLDFYIMLMTIPCVIWDREVAR